MLLKSIQSRVTLGFVGISLAAVLVHAVALAILQKFYPNLEYFRENAKAIGAFASAIAVLIAATVGWFISGLILAPVQTLLNAISKVAKPVVSSRVNVTRLNEFEQLQLSFTEMTHQVEASALTLHRFVADASHELHTPLTALLMNLELALDENSAMNREPFLWRAHTIAKRLEDLNTKLLELVRLEANGPAGRDEIIDLTELLLQRIEIYASQVEQADLLCEVDLLEKSIFIRGDVYQITSAMDHLVDNACKFTPPDGTVRIALSQKEEQVIFSVIDTGIGVPAEDLPQLFYRFHRGRNAKAYPGSGLGLAIVQVIATSHAGGVEVQSLGEGKGSRFAIRFPAVPPDLAIIEIAHQEGSHDARKTGIV